MKLNIHQLLQLKSLKGLRIIAGKSQIERRIKDVNILDNPDMVQWLTDGLLLLTTGYPFKDDPDFAEKLIRVMAERRCAGLAIKIKRYFETIPNRMIALAEEYELPLIEVPYEYSFPEITSAVYKEIMDHQARILKNLSRFSDILQKSH